MITTYEQAIEYIHGRSVWKKTPTLDRIRHLLKLLGNPETKNKFVHITGTNGKGSTTSFLNNILQMNGLKVGSFTSPYITKFNERISVNNQMISDAMLLQLVQQIEPIVTEIEHELKNDEVAPTEFEVITAMMFLYFSQNPVDIVLVEVGIGGIYDSTNVLVPLLSIITNVGFDHMHVLGHTITAIAQQKAGIIKNSPVIYGGRRQDEAGKVITQKAIAQKVPLYTMEDNTIEIVNSDQWTETFTISNKKLDMAKSLFTIKLLGKYQIDNAILAIMAYLLLVEKKIVSFSLAKLQLGLANTTWPGRFEVLSKEPQIVIDGAHNVPAMNGLSELLMRKFKNYQQINIIFAALADKQFIAMAKILINIPNVSLYVTEFSGPGNRQIADEMLIKRMLPAVNLSDNWEETLRDVAKNNPMTLTLVTGSLYFISEVRTILTH
ncbi:bifunctional folylpolyglutamate synthase/dihydrofolate synthase [Periweissella beninensis]|uniref:bifunctional folylpolyglutamate synthase/dihydrofolate synthase n=1 Tax=Periweissella beninensis TaxID=504936 RepID=UPI0021A53D90|nr:folylpolyglutamate synthase/dihydrofolate synthase family protein [Periweissella beninensis]MCT4395600.1 bifunctional folylpolyglutamate synthase/dihydrofolate synthase [Periweissella beninensis]